MIPAFYMLNAKMPSCREVGSVGRRLDPNILVGAVQGVRTVCDGPSAPQVTEVCPLPRDSRHLRGLRGIMSQMPDELAGTGASYRPPGVPTQALPFLHPHFSPPHVGGADSSG